MKNYVLKKWYRGKDHRKFTYPKDVDEELVPMLDVFNNIPGVRTVYSCCGHGYPGWYMDFRTTSDFMCRSLVDYFGRTGDGRSKLTDADFNVVQSEDFSLNAVPERRVTVYCDRLGMMNARDRRREYARICEFFSKFAPRNEWRKVHEF